MQSNDMVRRVAAVALLGAMAIPAVARAGGTCTVYEHRDFGGAHWTLHDGDVLRMIRPPQLGTSDGIHRFIYESSWNDKVSSFTVGPTCTLTLWEHVNYGGHHFRANRSRSYVGDRWNDKASDAVCECKGPLKW
ncbi:peptidase inhibitor family I36 protein [Pseudoduganella armeniaca]|nr:peptidase inhibitor family I36 protein [Pseudoduganella armeniaca]